MASGGRRNKSILSERWGTGTYIPAAPETTSFAEGAILQSELIFASSRHGKLPDDGHLNTLQHSPLAARSFWGEEAAV